MTNIDFYDPDVRLSVAEYRCSKAYDSFESSPFPEFCEGRDHSDLIDGNLVVMQPHPMLGEHYVVYLADPNGFISTIKESWKEKRTKEEAIAWAESDEFWCNKERYVAESDMPMFLFTEKESGPFKECFDKFIAGYTQYLKRLSRDSDHGMSP